MNLVKRLVRAVRAFCREAGEYPEVEVAADVYADVDLGGHFGNPTRTYREATGRNCPTCGGRGWAHMGNPPCPTCGS